MNPWSLAPAGRITRDWTRLYTAGLPAAAGEQRRGEIASDLWEHASWAGASGRGAHATAGHIFARTVLGMPSDVSWRLRTGGITMRSTFVYERGNGLVMLLIVLLIAAMLRSGQFVSGDDPYFGGEFFRFTRNLDGEFRAILFSSPWAARRLLPVACST